MNEFISAAELERFAAEFEADPINSVAMNTVAKNGVEASAINLKAAVKYPHTFSIDVPAGDVCNQKSSGRCWMFASLNVMRLKVMEKLNLKNTELSQTYPFFYDKLEKANYFLENILDTLDEPTDGRLISWLLSGPVSDGGQWDMFRSIVEKYGVVPQDVMPDTYMAENSRQMNRYITLKLREYACTLREKHSAGASAEELRTMKEEMLSCVYRILCICLGEPPKTFTWETRSKEDEFIRIENITPREFFDRYVGWNLDDYVTVINAPTADKPFGRTYTVKTLGSVRGGQYPVKYLNLPIEELKRIAVEQLKNGEVVWFGSDVGQFSVRDTGILALDSVAPGALFGTEFPMSKAQRLDYGESLMTHAMVLTGVNLDGEGRPNRWRVENSWGKEPGKDGYYVMSDEWFSEFTYQILLNRKYFTPEQSAQFDTDPIELAPWDPMGSLAVCD